MPDNDNYDELDLRVMRESLGLSVATAAKLIGNCTLTDWLNFELRMTIPPIVVIDRIHKLNELRISLTKLYLKKIEDINPPFIPFFSSYAAFKYYYPDSSEVSYSVFTTISRDIYVNHFVDKLKEVTANSISFDSGILMPECLDCELYTSKNAIQNPGLTH